MKRKKRNVLLLEPNYKNKYPPIGLMKLSTYHRKLGDNVVFYKGELKDFILKNLTCDLVQKLTDIDESVQWSKHHFKLKEYIKTGKNKIFKELVILSKYELLVTNWFVYYKDLYRKKDYANFPKWDRIYITTLFTFHWKVTIETIEFAKKLINDIKELRVGGVLATVLAEEVEKETGIKPHQGLLDKAGILDRNKIIIDDLPLDYSILDEIEYKYPENNAYYGYMTRGCIRKCSFCAVPKLEPTFQDFVPLKKQIKEASKKYGEKRNLLLLDNNVLASDCFPEIINEIKESGFSKDSRFIEPNQLDIAIKNLKTGYNDRAFVNKSSFLLHELLKKLKGENQQKLYDLMDSQNLLLSGTTTKEGILNIYPEIKDVYEKHRNKTPKQRYVDFNQGVDARLIVKDEEKMKLLSEIPIRPLRIAFDSMKYEENYVKAVKLAAKYGIKRLSNYLLYNEKDKPVELYQRLKINIELCESLEVDIYSFPMKFHPINGNEWYANRHFIGKHWNRKFLRAIQTILNATKGKVGKGKSFFYEAFGKDEGEYFKLLYMPETYILFRFFFKDIGYTENWWNEFNQFAPEELNTTKAIVEKNDFINIESLDCNSKIKGFIRKHYLISRDEINNPDSEIYKKKVEYDLRRKRK